jgi:hypothetical protein
MVPGLFAVRPILISAAVCHDQAMPTRTAGVRDRIEPAIAECQDALRRLQTLIAEPDRAGPRTGTIGRSAPHSRPPWNEQAADAYWNIWFGAGSSVILLRYSIGLTIATPPRGSAALEQIPNLTPSATDDVVLIVVRNLDKWSAAALAVPAIDEGEQWVPLPQVGSTPPACPYCHTFGLRMLKRAGEVRCFFPACTDTDGRPTRARMESGRMTGEARLVFADGTTMGVGNG